jgi:hypothetical protein
MPHTHMTQDMQDCISDCMTCHASCLETIQHCLQMGGEHASATHIRLLQDCAQLCMMSADFMLRLSPYHSHTCGVCADVCETCAQDCERLAGGDDVMQRCAEACRRCADSCRQMAAATSPSAAI